MNSFFLLLLNIIYLTMFRATAQNIAYTSPSGGATFGQVLPDLSFSPFANSLYNALTARNIFSRLFDVSFSPSTISSDFFSESQSFAKMLGVSDAGAFPQMVSDSASRFAKGLTPQQYFKAVANAVGNFLRGAGNLTLYNQEQLIQSYTSFLQEAVLVSDLLGAQAGLKALSIGTGNFLKSLGPFTPDQITSLMSTYVDEIRQA